MPWLLLSNARLRARPVDVDGAQRDLGDDEGAVRPLARRPAHGAAELALVKGHAARPRGELAEGEVGSSAGDCCSAWRSSRAVDRVHSSLDSKCAGDPATMIR